MDIQAQVQQLFSAVNNVESQVAALTKADGSSCSALVMAIPVALQVPNFAVRRNSVPCGEDFTFTRMGVAVEGFDGTGMVRLVPQASGWATFKFTGSAAGWLAETTQFDFKWNFVLERTQQAFGVNGNLSRRWLGDAANGRDLPLGFPKRVAFGERVAFEVEPVLYPPAIAPNPAGAPWTPWTPTTITVSLLLWGYRRGARL